MADNGVVCSMSRSGNVWDNAAMESFFSSLKTERTGSKTYKTRDVWKRLSASVEANTEGRCSQLHILEPRFVTKDQTQGAWPGVQRRRLGSHKQRARSLA
jgi:hypothetical protein